MKNKIEEITQLIDELKNSEMPKKTQRILKVQYQTEIQRLHEEVDVIIEKQKNIIDHPRSIKVSSASEKSDCSKKCGQSPPKDIEDH